MAKRNDGSSFAWFVAGLAMGAAAAVLFAPRSGQETRDSLAKAASKGRDFADRKRREATEIGREAYAQGREAVQDTLETSKGILAQGRELANEAMDAGKEALDRGKQILDDLATKATDDEAASSEGEAGMPPSDGREETRF